MDTLKATLVILGASGDLTHRLLLPGLGTLLHEKHYDVRLIGAAVDPISEDEWKKRVTEAFTEAKCPKSALDAVLASCRFEQLDATNPDDLRQFLDSITEPGRPIVLYFALPPAVSIKVCQALSKLQLPPDIRLGIEKPFGSDLQSAHDFNLLLTSIVREDQIFRVDHFLGKATVLNLLGLRFGNRIFEPTWNNVNIERVEIVIDETLALEGRAGYYDHAGALKDMIQSHLLLVMSIFAMEEPARVDSVELRDLMSHTLRQTHVFNDDGVANSRRARYTAGNVNGTPVPDYVAEQGVNPDNQTETLAEVTVEIRNARWAGVPFRLRSGKALGDGMRAIIVKYKDVDYLPEGFNAPAPANVLVIGMGPESLYLKVATNGEGSIWDFEETIMQADLGESPLRPYGEILEGILKGDPLLSVRGDTAEELWRITQPVIDAWESGAVRLDEYHAGSAGPTNWR